jgi:hypothetical protein
MSSVVWFYSVKGKVSSPQSWDELCAAVKEGRLGPDDLVWTKAFGREWRKASTLEGLFGNSVQLETPIVEEPELSAMPATESEQVLEPEPTNIEDVNPEEQQETPIVKQRVSVRLGLRRAYYGMLGILFATPFNIMRWIPLAVALFLASQMSTKFVMNATNAFLSNDKSVASKLTENKAELGLPEEFFTTGVFAEAWKNEVADLQSFLEEQQTLSQEELTKQLLEKYNRIFNGVGETCSYLWRWFKSFNGIVILGTVFMMSFLLKLALYWFGSRGQFMAMARCYNPTEPFSVTWRSVASASNRFFRLLVVVELIVSAIYLALTLTVIRYAAIAFDTQAISVEKFILYMTGLCSFYFVIMFINYYLKSFVALPVLLENKRITFRYIFRGFGAWVIRFGIIYTILLIGLQVVLGFVGGVVGAGLIQMIFTMPITGQLLALPVFVIHLLWTMDITIQLRPELAKKRPPIDPWQINR